MLILMSLVNLFSNPLFVCILANCHYFHYKITLLFCILLNCIRLFNEQFLNHLKLLNGLTSLPKVKRLFDLNLFS